MNEENKKISYNAISAYLLLMVSWSFLFIKENKLINNDLVKNHAKSSTILHIFMVFNYLFFIHFGFLDIFSIFGIGVNNIIASLVFFIIIIFSIFGIYKAFNFEKFNLGEKIKIKNKSILDITKNGDFGEKDKLTIIISYIPFIGYIIGSKYKKNPEIDSILKFNILITFLISLIFVFNYKQLTDLSILFYIIFIAFVGINLFGKNEFINFHLPDILKPKKQIEFLKALGTYLKCYVSGNFKSFEKVLEETEKKLEEKNNLETEKIANLKDFSGLKKIIYIPIINFLTLFQKENKYKIHIRNGIIISFIFIIFLVLIYFKIYRYKILVFLIFPICFGFGNLYKANYKMPYIYEIYEFFVSLKNIFFINKKKLNEKRREVKEINLKVNGK